MLQKSLGFEFVMSCSKFGQRLSTTIRSGWQGSLQLAGAVTLESESADDKLPSRICLIQGDARDTVPKTVTIASQKAPKKCNISHISGHRKNEYPDVIIRNYKLF